MSKPPLTNGMAEQFSAYADRLLQDALCGGTETTNSSTPATLTVRELRDMMDDLARRLGPPPPAIDLFGSDLVPDAIEIKPPQSIFPGGRIGRRAVIVPKNALDRWARILIQAGADVRIEPRIRSSDHVETNTDESNIPSSSDGGKG